MATCTIPYPTSKIVPEYTVLAPVESVPFEASRKPCVPLLMTLIPVALPVICSAEMSPDTRLPEAARPLGT
jgi:hypothetical protein